MEIIPKEETFFIRGVPQGAVPGSRKVGSPCGRGKHAEFVGALSPKLQTLSPKLQKAALQKLKKLQSEEGKVRTQGVQLGYIEFKDWRD